MDPVIQLSNRAKTTSQKFFQALSTMDRAPTPPRGASPSRGESPPRPPSETTVDHWSTDVEKVLYDIRSNSEVLARHHKAAYIVLQAQLVYFRVPLIILSALNSVFSVGLSMYLVQATVSTINCLVSLICACISSVELFLQIQKKQEIELASYHGYYLLGTRISATLKLSREHRETEGIAFLSSAISEYNNLFEQSNVNRNDIDDQLVSIINPHVAIKVTSSTSPLRMFARLPRSPLSPRNRSEV